MTDEAQDLKNALGQSVPLSDGLDEKTRISKQFWADDSCGNVLFITAYECPPNDGYWWVPQLGFSGSEGSCLFETKEAALKNAIEKAENILRNAERVLQKLQKQKNNVG